ncbi:hypothetical protein EVB91_229 [Rhizobium phage RHph_I1_18]|nr:hypothetical protein EVB91_229 [Rhizobium phage RHph_I1_18]
MAKSPYKDELVKLAQLVGEGDDPFAAWETIEPALEHYSKLLKAMQWKPINGDDPTVPRDRLLILDPAFAVTNDHPVIGKFCHIGGPAVSERRWMVFSDHEGHRFTAHRWREFKMPKAPFDKFEVVSSI